jgi:hypothetical protein
MNQVVIQQLSAADEAFLCGMVYHAIFVPEGMELDFK